MPQDYLDGLTPAAEAERLRAEVACARATRSPSGTARSSAGPRWGRTGTTTCPRRSPGCGEILAIYVLPGHQGAGIGRALLAYSLELLGDLRPALLWVARDNAPARRFYERYGFRADGASADLRGRRGGGRPRCGTATPPRVGGWQTWGSAPRGRGRRAGDRPDPGADRGDRVPAVPAGGRAGRADRGAGGRGLGGRGRRAAAVPGAGRVRAGLDGRLRRGRAVRRGGRRARARRRSRRCWSSRAGAGAGTAAGCSPRPSTTCARTG